MRVKQPETFDPKREYKPGERALYNGVVIIAEVWTKADQKIAERIGTLFCQRCVRCKIDRDICTGAHLQCDKYNRTDRKTIFWRLAYPQGDIIKQQRNDKKNI